MPVHVNACGIFDIGSCFSGLKTVEANSERPNSQSPMTALQAVNSPLPAPLRSQSDITIVGGTSLLADAPTASDSAPVPLNGDQISIYVVHKGDTLPEIAKMFEVTVNTIVWANDLKGKSITPGQTLVILPISGVQHTVKKGDTLQSIAKLYKGDLNEILQYNDLTLTSKIAIGDEIIIPSGEVTDVPVAKPTKKPNMSGVGTTGSPTPSYDGYYMRPIIGGIKTQGIHGHNGVDLASSEGSNILAAADGDVIISKNSGWNGGYGEYIVISHSNGTQTLYGHLSGTAVEAGDHVSQGQIIGYMGHTGQVVGHPGTHLHFEIRGARNPF